MITEEILFEISQRIWWHGSYNPSITKWRPFAHFGTWRAAIQRIWSIGNHGEKYCYFYPVVLNLGSTITMPDIFAEGTARDIYYYFRRYPAKVRKYPAVAAIVSQNFFYAPELYQAFKDDGITGITYKNKLEDRWSTSVIVIEPSSIGNADRKVRIKFSDLAKDNFGF